MLTNSFSKSSTFVYGTITLTSSHQHVFWQHVSVCQLEGFYFFLLALIGRKIQKPMLFGKSHSRKAQAILYFFVQSFFSHCERKIFQGSCAYWYVLCKTFGTSSLEKNGDASKLILQFKLTEGKRKRLSFEISLISWKKYETALSRIKSFDKVYFRFCSLHQNTDRPKNQEAGVVFRIAFANSDFTELFVNESYLFSTIARHVSRLFRDTTFHNTNSLCVKLGVSLQNFNPFCNCGRVQVVWTEMSGIHGRYFPVYFNQNPEFRFLISRQLLVWRGCFSFVGFLIAAICAWNIQFRI